MIYLNAILTLIAILFAGNLYANLVYGRQLDQKQEKAKEYQKETNDYMTMLHEEMIRELKKINGGK